MVNNTFHCCHEWTNVIKCTCRICVSRYACIVHKYYLQQVGSPIRRFILYLKTKWSSWRGEFKNCSDWLVPCSGWSCNAFIEATCKFALQIAARRQSLNTKRWLLLSVNVKFAIEIFRIMWDFKDLIFQRNLESNNEMIPILLIICFRILVRTWINYISGSKPNLK